MAKETMGKYGKAASGWLKIIWRAVGLLLLLAMPAVSYLLLEYVTGNLFEIYTDMAVWNVLWIFAFYLAAFALSGSTRVAVPLISAFFFVLSVAESFVVSFRGTPIMVWDILAVRTAMTVAENYVYEITEEMKHAAAILAALNLLLLFAPIRAKGWKRRLANGVGGAGMAVGFAFFFYSHIMPARGLEINMWEMDSTYRTCGYVLSTAVSLKYVVKKPPHGYSHAKLEEIYTRFGEDRGDGRPEGPMGQGTGEKEALRKVVLPEGDLSDMSFWGGVSPDGVWEGSAREENRAVDSREKICPVNLICIMNESLSDLKVAGDFSTNQPYFPFLDGLTENTVRGSLCVPVFGSMTSNSEYEFLTGDSVALLPSGSIAYQFYVKPGTHSLVSALKAQGYRTVAMHPYPGENWNRDVCYPNMGFDEFLSGDYYTGCETFRNYVSDRADYQKIIELVEGKKSPDDKLFVFNVTMQNHGGYEKKHRDFQEDVFLTGPLFGKYPKADQYLSLMKKSDEAFQGLLEYFENCGEPTMIVMFGDHQPGVEDLFYDEIAGMPSGEVPAKDRLMWYQTPFVAWTNYGQLSLDMGKLGAVFLSSHVLRLANLELTPYHRFLLEMSRQVPIVSPIGCYGQDGAYYSWEEAESGRCPFRGWVMDYEYLVYNHSMDGKKMDKLFELPPGKGP